METEGAGILLFPRLWASWMFKPSRPEAIWNISGQREVDEALEEGCLDSKSEVHSHSISVHPSVSHSTTIAFTLRGNNVTM